MSHVVIIGGGFAGLYLAKALGGSEHQVTLLDKRNFHLFQPFLYQVATGSLSPGDIASPLRTIVRKHKNIEVRLGEAIDLDPVAREVVLSDGRVSYDVLVVATGSRHHYFGHEEWEPVAPGLKTIEDAQVMRKRILLAFEKAEYEQDAEKRKTLLRFVLVGAGPTGVEMAGALAELSHATLKRSFRHFDPASAEILLVEAADRILPSLPEKSAMRAKATLKKLGVRVLEGTTVAGVTDDCVMLHSKNSDERLSTKCVLWTAGVKALKWGEILHERLGAELGPSGKVRVSKDLTVAENIYAVGDLAYLEQGGKALPGVAPCAMQMGRYVARRLLGKEQREFVYLDKGEIAVIGRGRAVAKIWGRQFAGFPAWAIWGLVHITYLIGFDNKLVVMLQWLWNYLTNARGTMLVVGTSQDAADSRESAS